MKKDPSKNKTFPSCTQEDTLKDTNRKLRAKVRKLESDKKKLLSEIRQHEATFRNTKEFLKNSTKELSLEEILDKVNKKDSSHEVIERKSNLKNICPDCLIPMNSLIFKKFNLYSCKCGHRNKVENNV